MLIISERINGLFKSIGRAIDARDEKAIKDAALRQIECGANALDLNVGPGRGCYSPETMKWLVETVQSVTDLPLCIDSPGIKTLEAGLAASNNPTIINSTTAEAEKMGKLFPLAAEYGSDIISTAMEHGVMPESILLDPLVLPVSAGQDQAWKVIESIRMFQMLNDPPIRTVVGLSNISNGATGRPLINRTYLAMLMGAGLSAAILDPEDGDLMDTLKTSEMLLDRKLYCSDYLRG